MIISRRIPKKLVMWAAFGGRGLHDWVRDGRKTLQHSLSPLEFQAIWMYYLFKRSHLNKKKEHLNVISNPKGFLIKILLVQSNYHQEPFRQGPAGSTQSFFLIPEGQATLGRMVQGLGGPARDQWQ